MKNIIISAENKSNIKLIVNLAEKLGMKAISLTKSQVEDWNVIEKINKGMSSKSVSSKAIFKALSE